MIGCSHFVRYKINQDFYLLFFVLQLTDYSANEDAECSQKFTYLFVRAGEALIYFCCLSFLWFLLVFITFLSSVNQFSWYSVVLSSKGHRCPLLHFLCQFLSSVNQFSCNSVVLSSKVHRCSLLHFLCQALVILHLLQLLALHALTWNPTCHFLSLLQRPRRYSGIRS